MRQLVCVAIFWLTPFIMVSQKIILDPCLHLCVILYADQSGTMNSAKKSLTDFALSMQLIPSESGVAETGLYSFEGEYYKWCEPTGNKDTLAKAIESFSNSLGNGGGTYPYTGLNAIKALLKERHQQDSTEIQVVLIHSDYFWSDFEFSSVLVGELLSNGVIVVLSLPKEYDGDTLEYYPIDEEKLRTLTEQGCINIRSNFNLFRILLEKLKAIIPCG